MDITPTSPTSFVICSLAQAKVQSFLEPALNTQTISPLPTTLQTLRDLLVQGLPPSPPACSPHAGTKHRILRPATNSSHPHPEQVLDVPVVLLGHLFTLQKVPDGIKPVCFSFLKPNVKLLIFPAMSILTNCPASSQSWYSSAPIGRLKFGADQIHFILDTHRIHIR